MTNHPNRCKTSEAAVERAVLVTTQHRGIFFGYATDVEGAIIKLRAARNCLSWSADVKGFIGLAVKGPSKNCRVGPAAEELQLRDITSVSLVTEEAVKAWEAAPWN